MNVYLRIVEGPGQGQVLPVPPGRPVTLGRSGQASYAFDDPLLSRRHCVVECREDMCRIVDLESRNGTFVNGHRVGAVLLRPADRIKIGGLLLEVEPVGRRPPDPAPRPAAPPASSDRATAPHPPGRCDACGAAVPAGAARVLRGRPLCNRCFDRLDVDPDLVEGFEVLERLAATSYGVSYLARQKIMDRVVVLKTIPMGSATEAERKTRRRFLREARVGGRLSHPGIVELYDVNEAGDLLYLVMEHVEGESLERRLRRAAGAPLPAGEVTPVMHQVAHALAHAHEQGVIHRDVKPANVLIRADGRAKLQGFVLAKSLEGASVITADGESLGTPHYMAPEQVRSARAADARSDVYGWGATAYHALTGRPPLDSRSYAEFIERVFDDAAVPPPLPPEVPERLAALVGRCLARRPEDRPESMAAVALELDRGS